MKTTAIVGNSVCVGRDGGFVAGDLVYPRRLRIPRPIMAGVRQGRTSTARAGNVPGFWAKRRLSNKATSTWRLGLCCSGDVHVRTCEVRRGTRGGGTFVTFESPGEAAAPWLSKVVWIPAVFPQVVNSYSVTGLSPQPN